MLNCALDLALEERQVCGVISGEKDVGVRVQQSDHLDGW